MCLVGSLAMADMATGISKFSLLSSEEAKDWSEQVLQASALWQRRAKGVDFYTLGAAHYLDLNPHQTTDHYQTLVHRYNPSLWERFEPLYWRLANFCADYFGGSFGFHENLALPGFHVFGPKPLAPDSFFNAMYFRQGGRVHSHPLPELLPSLLGVSKRQLASSMFSLTLALDLPAKGGGLNIWVDDVEREGPVFCPYQVGWMYGFGGDLKHQIAPVPLDQLRCAESRRITLQCHLITLNQMTYLFF